MKRPVDHVEPAPEAEFQFRSQLGVVLEGEKKDADEAQGVLAEGGRGKRPPVRRYRGRIRRFPCGRVARKGRKAQRVRLAFMPPQSRVAEGVGEVEQEGRVFVVVPHKRLHPAQDGAVLVMKTVADLALQTKREDIAGTFLLIVKFRPDAQEKIVSAVRAACVRWG